MAQMWEYTLFGQDIPMGWVGIRPSCRADCSVLSFATLGLIDVFGLVFGFATLFDVGNFASRLFFICFTHIFFYSLSVLYTVVFSNADDDCKITDLINKTDACLNRSYTISKIIRKKSIMFYAIDKDDFFYIDSAHSCVCMKMHVGIWKRKILTNKCDSRKFYYMLMFHG